MVLRMKMDNMLRYLRDYNYPEYDLSGLYARVQQGGLATLPQEELHRMLIGLLWGSRKMPEIKPKKIKDPYYWLSLSLLKWDESYPSNRMHMFFDEQGYPTATDGHRIHQLKTNKREDLAKQFFQFKKKKIITQNDPEFKNKINFSIAPTQSLIESCTFSREEKVTLADFELSLGLVGQVICYAFNKCFNYKYILEAFGPFSEMTFLFNEAEHSPVKLENHDRFAIIMPMRSQ